MPAAKSDVRRWYGRQAEERIHVKQACDACRQAKIRCLRTTESCVDSADGACARCERLGLHCHVRAHNKGRGKRQRTEEVAVNRGIEACKASSAFDGQEEHVSPPFHTFPSASSLAAARHNDDASLHDDERSPMAKKHLIRPEQDYSTSSLFRIDAQGEAERLRMSTMASQLRHASHAAQDRPVPVHQRFVPSAAERETDEAEGQRVEVDLLASALFSQDDIRRAHEFYFDTMNGCIALLTPQLNTLSRLLDQPKAHFLLTSICAVSARFLWPERCVEAFALTERYVARFHAGRLPACLEHCQAFSILSMWRMPTDPTGWRKLHAAITIAFELDLPSIASRLVRPGENVTDVAQKQRTLFQITCAEEHFRVQRRIGALLELDGLPDARAWIESLGDACLDIDVRIAAALDQIGIYRQLQRLLVRVREQGPSDGAWSTSMQELRLLNKARSDQLYTADIWLNAQSHGIPQPFAKKACGLFNKLNHAFNYYQALLSIYARPVVRSRTPNDVVSEAFAAATETACALVEMLKGHLAESEQYRFVHDNTTCSIAASALWIVDHWSAMAPDQAARARNALIQASETTAPSASRWYEQSAYLHRLLTHCSTRLAQEHRHSLSIDVFSQAWLGATEQQDGYADVYSWLMSMFSFSGDEGEGRNGVSLLSFDPLLPLPPEQR